MDEDLSNRFYVHHGQPGDLHGMGGILAGGVGDNHAVVGTAVCTKRSELHICERQPVVLMSAMFITS